MFVTPCNTLSLVFLLLPSHLLLSAQEPKKPSPEQQQQVTDLVNIQRNWGDKLNTPGATLRLVESRREQRNGRLVVAYQLFATGLPADVLYTIQNLAANETVPKTTLRGVTLAQNGNAICAGRTPYQCGGERLDDPIDAVYFPVKGEPQRVALVSEDGQYRVFASVVSEPIQGKDNGCEISVIRLMPKFELALVQGTGFPPDSEVQFESSSHGESHGGQLKANKDGYVDATILPFVKGKKSGETVVQFTSLKCKPSTRFKWGVIE